MTKEERKTTNLRRNYDVQLLPDVLLEFPHVNTLDLLGVVDELGPNAPDLSLYRRLEIFIFAHNGCDSAFSTIVRIIEPTAKPVIVVLEELSVKWDWTITLSCDRVNARLGDSQGKY